MKGTFRLWARGLRRRLSNIAWGFGASAVATLVGAAAFKHILPFRAPEWMAYGILAFIGGAFVTTAAATLMSWIAKAPRKVDMRIDEESVFLRQTSRRIPFASMTGVLRFGTRVWLCLEDGNIADLDLEDEDRAGELEELVKNFAGNGRMELVPHPTAGTTGAVFLALTASCALFSLVGQLLESAGMNGGVAVALTLATMLMAAASVGNSLRGKSFVVGRDGVRLGKDFVSFGAIRAIRFVKQRVTIVDDKENTYDAKVRMPEALADALEKAIKERLGVEADGELVFERGREEDVHVWLERIRKALQERDFRNPVVPKERAVQASKNPKSPLRVRVAALAALMDEEPELVEALAAETADPRLEKLARASGDPAAWRHAVSALEREGELEP